MAVLRDEIAILDQQLEEKRRSGKVIGADEMAELEELRARLAVVVRQCESEKRAEAPSGIKYGRTEEASPYRSMEDLTTALMSERLWRAEVIKFVHEIRKVGPLVDWLFAVNWVFLGQNETSDSGGIIGQSLLCLAIQLVVFPVSWGRSSE